MIKWLLLAVLGGWLYYKGRADLVSAAAFLTPANVPHILAVSCFLIVNLLLCVVRQQMLLARIGGGVRFRDMALISYAGFFSNNFLPGAMGGDIVRLYYLKQFSGQGYARLSGFVLLDRLAGLVGMATLAGITLTLFLLFTERNHSLPLYQEGYAVFLVALVPVVLMGTVLALRSKKVYGLLDRLAGRFFGGGVGRFLESMQLFAGRRRMLLAAVAVSVAAMTSTLLGITYMAWVLNGKEAAMMALAFSPIVFLMSVVPVTPGNIGWTEAVAGTLWSLFQAPGGLTLFVLWRVICLLVSLGGGLAYLKLGGGRAAHEARSAGCAE